MARATQPIRTWIDERRTPDETKTQVEVGKESGDYLVSKGIKVGTHYGIYLHLPSHVSIQLRSIIRITRQHKDKHV